MDRRDSEEECLDPLKVQHLARHAVQHAGALHGGHATCAGGRRHERQQPAARAQNQHMRVCTAHENTVFCI